MSTQPSQTQLELIDAIAQRGVPDPIAARIALHATLAALGARLMDDEAFAFASLLPPELGYILEQCEHDGTFDADSFYARVAFHTRLPPGRAREQADVVLRVLGELLVASQDEGACIRIGRGLPELIRERLFYRADENAAKGEEEEEEEEGETAPKPFPSALPSTTSTSRVPTHSHSVARNPNPHEEVKLSSARGLTQERLGESLSTYQPRGRERGRGRRAG